MEIISTTYLINNLFIMLGQLLLYGIGILLFSSFFIDSDIDSFAFLPSFSSMKVFIDIDLIIGRLRYNLRDVTFSAIKTNRNSVKYFFMIVAEWVKSMKITSNTIPNKTSSSSTYQVVKGRYYSTSQQKKKWTYGTLKFHQNVVVKALPVSLQKPPSRPSPNLTQKFYCPVHIYSIFTVNIQTNSKILQTYRDLESVIYIACIHNQTSKPISIAPFEIFPLISLWRILDHDKIISGCGWSTFQTEKKNDKKILVSDFTFGFWIRSRSNDMENPQLSLA